MIIFTDQFRKYTLKRIVSADRTCITKCPNGKGRNGGGEYKTDMTHGCTKSALLSMPWIPLHASQGGD